MSKILYKRLTSAICIILLCISNVSAANVNDDGLIKVTEVVKSPFLSPGDKNVELQLMINNEGESTLSNVKVFLYLQSPFLASLSENNKFNEITYPGYLVSSGDTEHIPYFNLAGKQGRIVKFRIDVEKDAKYGNYDIPYAIYYADNKVINGKFNVRVSGSTLIELSNVSTSPENIVTGNDFEIAFNVTNIGENKIKWVKIDVSNDEKKIIPISSTTERIFTDIESKDVRIALYKFSTDKKITPKNYPFKVELSYQDENGILYNETKIIGARVLGKAEPDIASVKIEPDRIIQGDPFTLTIRVENNEQGDARSVKAEIDIPINGDKTAFLGKIAADEDAPAVYMLRADKSGNIDYNLTIYYVDDTGEHTKTQKMSLLVSPKENSNIFMFGGLTLVFVVGFLFWRSKKEV